MANIRKKVEEQSRDTLSKKQFQKVVSRTESRPSLLQQRAQTQVAFAKSRRNLINTTPLSSFGRIPFSPIPSEISGYLDFSFAQSGSGLDAMVYTVALTGTDIYAGGNFTMYNGDYYYSIAKFSSNGTISTFNSGSNSFNDYLKAIAVQSDGKVVVGGLFSTYSGSAQSRIARLNTDGTLDTSFNIGDGFDANVRSLALQEDGKIVAGGDFNNYSGSHASGIVRLNTDGTIDNTFLSSSGFDHSGNGSVWCVKIQSDGKLLVGGEFSSYSGSTSNKLIRLNSDGTVDNTFNVGSGFDNRVQTIDIHSTGKIVVGGQFNSYSGSGAFGIALLNSDGTCDSNFNQGSGFDGWVNVTKFQNASSIYVGGQFSTYSGSSVNSIVRLNTNGTLNTSFTVSGSGFNDYVNSIDIQNDGRLVVGGWFNYYDNVPVNYIARIYG